MLNDERKQRGSVAEDPAQVERGRLARSEYQDLRYHNPDAANAFYYEHRDDINSFFRAYYHRRTEKFALCKECKKPKKRFCNLFCSPSCNRRYRRRQHAATKDVKIPQKVREVFK